MTKRTLPLEERVRVTGTSDVLWTPREAAAALGISRTTLDSLSVPRIRFGTVVRYCPRETMAFARARLTHRVTTPTVATDATTQSA